MPPLQSVILEFLIAAFQLMSEPKSDQQIHKDNTDDVPHVHISLKEILPQRGLF